MANDAGPITRLVLVRHGESQVMVDNVVGGHKACSGLSDLGRRQALALRARLERTGELKGADHLYASVMARAVETAQLIAPALGIDTDDIVQQCGLCESHPGDADGMTWDELRAQHPLDPATHNEFEPWAPGAESWAEFVARTSQALHRLARSHAGQTVVVACHGGVVAASLTAFARLPYDRNWRAQVDNCSITEWVHSTPGGYQGDRPIWTLVRLNDASHLLEV